MVESSRRVSSLIALLGVAWMGLAATLFLGPELTGATHPGVIGGEPGASGRGWRLPGAGRSGLVPICAIQGNGFNSPYLDQGLRTQGVVSADLDDQGERGFFLQQEGCDPDPETSDGLFVFLGMRADVVRRGDQVEVAGVVQEFFGQTELSTSPGQVMVLASDQPTPPAVELNPPFELDLARAYFESLEGMLVRMDDARVVGPTGRFDETWVVRRDLGVARFFPDEPPESGAIVTVLGRGLTALNPPARVGDRVLGLEGPLGFSLGAYQVHLIEPPTVLPEGGRRLARARKGLAQRFRRASTGSFAFQVATFNLKNLFDTHDDPMKEDPVPSAATYQRQLAKLAQTIHAELGEPTLIAVQEVENLDVLEDLAARPEIQSDYTAVWVEGPDVRGIDVALLYQTGRVQVMSAQVLQGCTTLIDGLGPDGNRDVNDPTNQITCDSDGDGVLDGNRLFSRPPMLVQLQICAVSCPLVGGAVQGQSLVAWMMVNHWKSKSQDSDWVQHTLPRRLEQAHFVAHQAGQILETAPDANLIVLGDFNDWISSQPLSTLANAGLANLMPRLERPERYTFIYQGVSQVLDHILVSPALQDDVLRLSVAHINADYPAIFEDAPQSVYRSSDHDPVVAQLMVLPHKVFLPIGSLNR